MSLFWRRKKPAAPTLPALQTERLVLRGFDPNDAVDVFAYAKSENVGPRAGWQPHQTLEDSRRVVDMFIREGEVWAVVEKRSGRVIGSVGLHKRVGRRCMEGTRELGYALGEEHWGQGYGMEASSAALRYAFETLDCPMVCVSHFPFNQQSKRLIKKLGFVYEGTLRRTWKLPDGSYTDELVYSMLKEEYEARNGGCPCRP